MSGVEKEDEGRRGIENIWMSEIIYLHFPLLNSNIFRIPTEATEPADQHTLSHNVYSTIAIAVFLFDFHLGKLGKAISLGPFPLRLLNTTGNEFEMM